MNDEVEAKLHAIFGVERQMMDRPTCWVGPRTAMDILAKKRILFQHGVKTKLVVNNGIKTEVYIT
jgi:hypothetical protein